MVTWFRPTREIFTDVMEKIEQAAKDGKLRLSRNEWYLLIQNEDDLLEEAEKRDKKIADESVEFAVQPLFDIISSIEENDPDRAKNIETIANEIRFEAKAGVTVDDLLSWEQKFVENIR